MASIKASKGNPFEYNTAYSLIQAGYKVSRPDTNLAGVDLIVSAKPGIQSGGGDDRIIYYVECKHHASFSWNELTKYLEKTKKQINGIEIKPLVIFRPNRHPVLMMMEQEGARVVLEYNDFFGTKWTVRPKGYQIWKE